jgi:predicted enzyme related to lactoylglutathione lyase
MTVISKYKPGEFCWTDLGTTDVPGALKFYKGVFGCKVVQFPMEGSDEKYSILQIDGRDVCAVYPMSAEQRKARVRPYWRPYITVKSVAETLKKAKAAGGKVVMGPMAVGDLGRTAIVKDPTGAPFALWQPGTMAGAGIEDKAGTVTWHDLNTFKPAVAGKFYVKVFGWKIEDKDFDGNEYHMFALGREGVCGMWPSASKKILPSWVTHWKVSDCAKTVAKVKQLGGGIILGATAVPGMGHFAIVKDPKGAPFGIIGK